MIYEERTYTLYPGMIPAFLEVYEKRGTLLNWLSRAVDGSFNLIPGATYVTQVEAYSLDVGGPPPAKVGAFFPAPYAGQRGAAIQTAMKQAELHPEIKQPQLQAFFSAMVAGTDFAQMSPVVQQVAVALLPHPEVAKLQPSSSLVSQRGLMSILKGQLQAHGVSGDIAKGEADLQRTTGYSDARTLLGPPAAPSIIIPEQPGSWALMPGGFYVRYLPESPSKIDIEVYVLDTVKSARFDPTLYVAVLGATPSQRLGITMRSPQ
jgi:hypothetical protein